MRHPTAAILLFLSALSWAGCASPPATDTSATAPDAAPAIAARIPVIFDTDLGTDIDDTWALGLLLASPELDLKLVLTDSGDTRTRAALAARFLEEAGRTDIPVGIGIPEDRDPQIPIGQAPWVEGYDLNAYPGTVIEDGVQALIDIVRDSPEQVTLLAVGPVPNLEVALERAPDLATKLRVVAMSGSVNLGYNSAPEPSPEYNVAAHVSGSQRMYEAGWDLLIAPLDTAGQVQLRGELYQRLVRSNSRTVQAILENYRVWEPTFEWGDLDVATESSVLFDALAVSLVHRPETCLIEEVRLTVDDRGMTSRSPDGNTVRAALGWPEGGRQAFEEFLVERLLTLP